MIANNAPILSRILVQYRKTYPFAILRQYWIQYWANIACDICPILPQYRLLVGQVRINALVKARCQMRAPYIDLGYRTNHEHIKFYNSTNYEPSNNCRPGYCSIPNSFLNAPLGAPPREPAWGLQERHKLPPVECGPSLQPTRESLGV